MLKFWEQVESVTLQVVTSSWLKTITDLNKEIIACVGAWWLAVRYLVKCSRIGFEN